MISRNTVRNGMILEDTRNAVKEGRTPVILTRYKEQAKYLYDNLQGDADYVLILYGDNSDKDNSEVRKRLKEVTRNQSLILVATGQKIGEGFDYPRLDPLMLAAPVSFAGRLEQYIGRIQRMQECGIHVIAKEEVIEHFAIIDDELVWRGGINLLGKEDA